MPGVPQYDRQVIQNEYRNGAILVHLDSEQREWRPSVE